jgi:hypothetical protein
MDSNELVTKEELEKFKEIARKDYGVELTDEQAYEQAAALINFFEAVMKDLMEKKRR